MSKLKDKLSANMRMVKANQQPGAAQPAKAATSSKPTTETKPAAQPTSPARTPATSKATSGEIPASGTALFPTRVWPD